MPRKILPVFFLLASGFWLLASPPALAQNPPATAPATPPGPRGFDPAAIRTRIMDRLKTALAPTDDEWKLIEPKLAKIILLQLDVTVLPNAFGSAGASRFFGPGGLRAMVRSLLDPNALPSQVEEKSQDLQQLIDNNETSNSAYTNALAQLRKARERARTDLATAQKDLSAILTVRQEAALVQLGLLE